MAFIPSELSRYDGWYDDVKAAAEAKYTAAKSYVTDSVTSATNTALAPVRAAQATVDTAAKTAADVRAAAEAARDTAAKTASMVPWIVGGIVVVGGMYLYSRKRVSNPRENPDAHMVSKWLLLGGAAAGATGLALTSAGAATLQPEVLALSGPLMVGGAALTGISVAVDNFGRTP
jgi:hypothetical protein